MGAAGSYSTDVTLRGYVAKINERMVGKESLVSDIVDGRAIMGSGRSDPSICQKKWRISLGYETFGLSVYFSDVLLSFYGAAGFDRKRVADTKRKIWNLEVLRPNLTGPLANSGRSHALEWEGSAVMVEALWCCTVSMQRSATAHVRAPQLKQIMRKGCHAVLPQRGCTSYLKFYPALQSELSAEDAMKNAPRKAMRSVALGHIS